MTRDAELETRSAPSTPVAQSEVLRDLVTNGSIELCDSGYAIPALPEILPYKKGVFVPATRKRPLPAMIDTLRKLEAAGFDPIPHIAARRISSRSEIELFLKNAVQLCSVRRVLLIGGDVREPVGPFRDARALLQDGVLQGSGVKEIAFAGYPDVHPIIPQEELERELLAKIALAQESNIGASIVTQFSFVPRRIVNYCAMLSKMAPRTPVYVGIPGPCDPVKLLKYAKICGVSVSTKMLGDFGFKAVQLAIHSDPGEQLQMVARGVSSMGLDNVVGAHIFSFGDIQHAARWMQSVAGNAVRFN